MTDTEDTTYYSYSGTHSEQGKRPKEPITSVAKLCAFVERSEPGELTLRGTGNALGKHALGRGTVLELHGLPHRIAVHPSELIVNDGDTHWPTLEATGWTTWESVVRASLRLGPPARWGDDWSVPGQRSRQRTTTPHRCRWAPTSGPAPRFMPYVVPSSGRITLGGGISGDTMWRYSSLVGKESRSVLWLDVLTYDRQGEARACKTLRLLNPDIGDFDAQRALHSGSAIDDLGLPPLAFAADANENKTLFYAVIGGHGLTGPVVRVKYLLLTLQENFDHREFDLLKPKWAEPVDAPYDPQLEEEWDDYVEEFEERYESESDKGLGRRWYRSDPYAWPRYPHASERHVERGIGKRLRVQNLTWMFPVEQRQDLFYALLKHHFAFQSRLKGPVLLPKQVDKGMVAAFGLFFPMSGKMLLGNLAYGRRRGFKRALPILRRRSVWKNLGLVVGLTPKRAEFAERQALNLVFNPLVRRSTRRRPAPSVNSIPDFALFMEGHTIGMQRTAVPQLKTVQMTWVIPVRSCGDAGAESGFQFLLEKLQTRCSLPVDEGGIAIQSCDIKVVPASPALLSSAPLGPGCQAAVAVTAGIENGAGYPNGALEKALAEISREAWESGIRVHLTKNVYAPKADLRGMYEDGLTRFRAAKARLDPDGLYTSSFLEETLDFDP